MEEKQVAGFPNYRITTDGRVYTYSRGYRKDKKVTLGKAGYYRVGLWNNSGKPKIVSVHRLVAESFIPNPENKPQVNHINGIKTDNRVENLEWATPSENTQHAYDLGLANGLKGEESSMNKYEESLIREVCELLQEDKLTPQQIADRVDLPTSRVYAIIHKSSWAHVSDEYDIKKTKATYLKKLPEDIVRDICGCLNAGHTPKEVSDVLGYSYNTVWQIKARKRYKKLSEIYLH